MMRRRTLLTTAALALAGGALLAEHQWVLFDSALRKTAPASDTQPSSDVFITSENVLQVMDRITTLYSGLKA